MKFIFYLTIFFCSVQAQAQGYDTLKVYFRLNDPTLTAAARHTLDSFLSGGLNKQLLIYGYADYLGSEPDNIVLATDRAKNVRHYLLSKNVSEQNILICAGIGEVSRNKTHDKDGYPPDRRVEIFIRRKNKGKSKIVVTTDTGKAAITQKSKTSIDIDRLKTNETLQLRNINFQPGRHFIREDSKPALEELYTVMSANPGLEIRIEGHICCTLGTGDDMDMDTHQPTLSVNRARYIYDYLISKGISASRLKYIGFGHSRPLILYERSEEDANANRRVEIRILKK